MAALGGWRGIQGLIDDAIDNALTKYARNSPEMKKIANLEGINPSDLDKRLDKIHDLIRSVPQNAKRGKKNNPAWVVTRRHTKSIEDTLNTSTWRVGWDRSSFGSATFGEGLYLNTNTPWSKGDWGLSGTRETILKHELEHVVTAAILKVMGVDRDDAKTQPVLARVNPDVEHHPDKNTPWSDDPHEMGGEWRMFGDYLASNSDAFGSSRDEQFTEESLKALAFFSLIHQKSGGRLHSKSASDDKIEEWIEAARNEWPAALGDPDDWPHYRYESSHGPMWRLWVDQKDSGVPINHTLLPKIKKALITQTLSSLSDLKDDLNRLAVAEQPDNKEPTV